MRKIWSHIVIHHSLTRDGQTVSWQAIRRYHSQTLGWDDIGYHYGIELISRNYEVLVGRDINQNGAHAYQQSMNKKGIGICFVGNFDEYPVPPQMWERGIKFIRSLMDVHGVPLTNIIGHRDVAPKSCPGKLFDLKKLVEDLR
ncbi:MAG: peptidoglycan recognition family protein [Candidatus Hodarchaeota archaeon]